MMNTKSICSWLINLLIVFNCTCQLQTTSIECKEVNEKPNQLQAIWSKVSGAVQTTLAPEIEYVNLMKRFQSWFQRYKAVQTNQMKNGIDVLIDEYAKVDEELQQEACHAAPAEEQVADSKKVLVKGDDVYKALRLVIDRLELSIKELELREKEVKPKSISEEEERKEENLSKAQRDALVQENDERVKKAMERIKKNIVNRAQNLITTEAFNVAKLAALNGAAAYVAQQQVSNPSDPILLLTPIISLLGSASTPLLASYLRNIETRSALNLINRLNPIEAACKLGSNLGIRGPNFDFAHLKIDNL